MNEINIDTVKMKEKGNEIIDQVEELKLIIYEMFSRIENIPDATLEWTGDSAHQFVSLAKLDKVQYYNFADDLYKYGKYLIDCADSFEQTIKEIRRD